MYIAEQHYTPNTEYERAQSALQQRCDTLQQNLDTALQRSETLQQERNEAAAAGNEAETARQRTQVSHHFLQYFLLLNHFSILYSFQQTLDALQQTLDNLQRDEDMRWLISRDAITWHERDLIGRGGFGAVFRGEWHGFHVAVKRLDENLDSPFYVQEWKRELRVNASLRHPNVVHFWGACVTQGAYPLVVMELHPASLRDIVAAAARDAEADHIKAIADAISASVTTAATTAAAAAAPSTDSVVNASTAAVTAAIRAIQPKRAFTMREQLDLMTGIARGLNYLHGTNYTHSDVSDANVLITPDMTAKIADLGEAHLMRRTHTTLNALNTPYCAPERLPGAQVDAYRADVFSTEMVMLQVGTSLAADRSRRLLQLQTADPAKRMAPESLRALTTECVAEQPTARPERMHIVLQRLLQIQQRECAEEIRQCPPRRRVVRDAESGRVLLLSLPSS